MCFSSTASFAMSGLLAAGGAFCLFKAEQEDHRYLPMAFMPVAVAVQQFSEGLAWVGLETGDMALLSRSALTYMFFVWVFWSVWTAFMTYALEPNHTRRRILAWFMAAGFVFGLILYLPYTVHPEWLHVQNIKHSLDYNTILLPDRILPRIVTSAIYLFLVGGMPLLSSHRPVRLFGWLLIIFVPITYAFFAYADVSVLCFFAAAATVYLIFIIVGNKCAINGSVPLPLFNNSRAF